MPKVTTQQAAKMLGMTVQGVRALITKGNLRAEKIGRDYLLNAADVERAKANRPAPGRPPEARPRSHKPKGKR